MSWIEWNQKKFSKICEFSFIQLKSKTLGKYIRLKTLLWFCFRNNSDVFLWICFSYLSEWVSRKSSSKILNESLRVAITILVRIIIVGVRIRNAYYWKSSKKFVKCYRESSKSRHESDSWNPHDIVPRSRSLVFCQSIWLYC